MTRTAWHSRFRAFVSHLDLGYTVPLVVGVLAFIAALLIYFGVL